jgi:hypothetical protein
MSDWDGGSEAVHCRVESIAAVWPHSDGWSALACMEKINEQVPDFL